MSEISKQALLVDNSQSFPNNNIGAISPSDLRAFNVNMIDSLVDEITYNQDSASWNNSISALNTFSSSQQPSFTALNNFTASQLTINSGVNLFTQSTTGRLDALENDTANLELFTSSINQIIVNGVSIGTSTRLWFNGFVSASIIQNVGGPIASITVLADQTFASSASFNEYTASTNAFTASAKISISALNSYTASQNSFNASATASLVELLNLSSSLSGGYATQGELDYSSSVLQTNIDTVSSSLNTRVDVISSFTGSYATTGSNVFVGNQILTGSLLISSSAAVDLIVTGAMGITGNIVSSGSLGQITISNVATTIVSNAQTSSATYGRNVMTQASGSNRIGMAANPEQGNWISGLTKPSIFVSSGSITTNYAPIQFERGDAYTDGRVTFTTPISASAGLVGNTRVTGSLTITGSLSVTGSITNNVFSASIVSSTASIDFSSASFFTLTLPAATNTNINVQNIRPGQSAMLEITTAGAAATASFSTNVYQPSASFYVPTNAAGNDILTFSSFASNKIYLVSVKTMINA